MMLYLRLFYEFFKAGLFAIGGGMATIPFLYNMADATGWFTYNDLANMIAVGESTPGPIGVNMATYVGYITGQGAYGTPGALLGALIATVGLVTPSVIIILLVAAVLNSFRSNTTVDAAFYGLRPASTGLIAAAGLSVVVANLLYMDNVGQGILSVFNWKGWVLAVALWLLTNCVKRTKGLHPIIFILASAVIGVIFQM
jgi:chromate transporter